MLFLICLISSISLAVEANRSQVTTFNPDHPPEFSEYLEWNRSHFIGRLDDVGNPRELIEWATDWEEWTVHFIRSISSRIIFNDERIYFSLPSLRHQYFTYMPIRTITSTTSRQWALRRHLSTDQNLFVRFEQAYAVALGTYYSRGIGSIYEIEFANGEVILAILGDIKANIHTDVTNRYRDARYVHDGAQGNVVEFILDDSTFRGLQSAQRTALGNSLVHTRFRYPAVRITYVGRIDV